MVRRALGVAVAAAVLLIGMASCTDPKEKASQSGGVPAPVDMGPETTEPTTATTALSMAAVVLAPDGVGPVPFGTQAARALNALTQALGRAEHITVVPPGANCAVTRIFRWKNFEVLVNEASARSGGRPGLVGWSLGAAAPAALGLKTDKGVGIGSTAAAVKAAYGSAVATAPGANGPSFEVTAPNGTMTVELDGPGDAARVKALRAGATCAA